MQLVELIERSIDASRWELWWGAFAQRTAQLDDL